MADLTLFLVGRAGSGKSSTGNSLLGREEFQVFDGTSSTCGVQVATGTTPGGRRVSVIDGPGIDFRDEDTEEFINTMEGLKVGIQKSGKGVSAFLLVLGYGNRFTLGEQSTVDSFKTILGDDFLKDYCIVVFTHGELFDMANKQRSLSFKGWCQGQTGGLQLLIADCGNRCVLAYNTDQEKMALSIESLLQHVDKLMAQRNPYTVDMLRNQEKQCQFHIDKLTAVKAQHVVNNELDVIQNKLKQLQEREISDREQDLPQWIALHDTLKALVTKNEIEDRNTGVLTTQHETCTTLMQSVQGHIETLRQAKEAKERQAVIKAIEHHEDQGKMQDDPFLMIDKTSHRKSLSTPVDYENLETVGGSDSSKMKLDTTGAKSSGHPGQTKNIRGRNKFTGFGQDVGARLEEMPQDQARLAQKLIIDVLYEGELGKLSKGSHLGIGSSEVTEGLNSMKRL